MSDTGQPATSFRARIFSSAKLSSLQFLSNIGLRLISTVVLTRLLAPEIYGVFAVVLVYRYLLEMFSDLGLRSVILTKEGDLDDRFLQTCWTVAILRGAFIAVGSGLIGLVIAWMQIAEVFPPDSAYNSPALPAAIAILGLVSWLMGFQSTNRYAQERGMSFGLVTIGMVISNIFGLIVTIGLAYTLRSVWALVFGAFAQSSFLVVFSFFAFRGPSMRLALDRESLGIIIGRGKWIIGHSILNALAQAADRLLLGFVMSSSTFGFYFLARQIIDIVNNFLHSVNGQMGLQVFRHILQSANFTKNYYKYRLIFDALAGLSAGGLFILAPLAVEVIFDDRYSDVAPIVQILVFGLLMIGPLLLRDVYSAERKFREMTYLSLVSTISLWIGLLISIFLLENLTVSLIVISIHRLPEALILGIMGYRRNWILPLREILVVVFFAVGAGLGWLALELWKVLV